MKVWKIAWNISQNYRLFLLLRKREFLLSNTKRGLSAIFLALCFFFLVSIRNALLQLQFTYSLYGLIWTLITPREQCPSVVIIKSQLLPGVCAPTHSSYRGWLYYILHRCSCAAFCCRDNWETKYSSTHRGAYRHRVLCNSLAQRQQWLCCCTARIEPILHSNIDI